MDFKNFIVDLGIAGLILLVFILILLPIIIALVLGIAIANFFAVSGITWWCLVIFMALIIYGVIYKLYEKK